MNIYEKIYCEELVIKNKAYSELCDITDRQIRDFERIKRLDPSRFSPIISGLLREGKPLCDQAEHLFKQINYHLKQG